MKKSIFLAAVCFLLALGTVFAGDLESKLEGTWVIDVDATFDSFVKEQEKRGGKATAEQQTLMKKQMSEAMSKFGYQFDTAKKILTNPFNEKQSVAYKVKEERGNSIFLEIGGRSQEFAVQGDKLEAAVKAGKVILKRK